ncbi:hypothetical protein AgCh_012406 [Apium graveolens]
MAVASQTLILRSPTSISPLPSSLAAATGIAFAIYSSRNSRPKTHSQFSPKPNFYKPYNLTLSTKNPSKPYPLACCSKIKPSPSPLTESNRPALTESTPPLPLNPTRLDLSESTWTVSTLVATVILVSKLFGHAIVSYLQGVCKMPEPNQLRIVQGLQENMISSTSPLFFAAMKFHRRQLHTPWTVMASGLAKCIEVYMAVLAIRCALGYFPNVEWKQQPYSGLRDICDPFLLFFRNIVPPVFDSLDISLSVGFLVLTVLVEILTSRSF